MIIQGYITPLLCQYHSSTFVYGPILMPIYINANIRMIPFFHKIYDLKRHFYAIEQYCDFFTLRPSDLNKTWTYVLMDNFCPCFFHRLYMQVLINCIKSELSLPIVVACIDVWVDRDIFLRSNVKMGFPSRS